LYRIQKKTWKVSPLDVMVLAALAVVAVYVIHGIDAKVH